MNGRPFGRAAILLLSLGILASCGKNPLIGHWKLNLPPTADMLDKIAASAIGDEIEFEPGTMVTGAGVPVKVQYDQRDGRWFVTPEGQSDQGLPVKVVGDDKIEIDIGHSKPIPYVRTK
ncbi:hypothetical protein [Nitrospirillum viridazoti]|uniref:hypothetical protein n=1 Tax=Nitrospirillum viridazoti TaxID=3144925 RepID=UPI0011A180A2|nr:hypothetical protein [Nitrospirillum amazonense]